MLTMPSPHARRGLALALASMLVLGGTSVTATGPTSDPGGFPFDFRDRSGETVVLAIYPDGPSPLPLERLRIRGPRVGWADDHPLAKGAVRWRLIIKSAPDLDGPWTVQRRTSSIIITADRDDPLETFRTRTLAWTPGPRRFLRVISRLTWLNEDGGTLGWVRHAYTRYGLVVEDGTPPRFGDEEATRSAVPTRWRR